MSLQIFLDSAEDIVKIDYLPKVLNEGLTSTPPRNKFHKVFANCSASAGLVKPLNLVPDPIESRIFLPLP